MTKNSNVNGQRDLFGNVINVWSRLSNVSKCSPVEMQACSVERHLKTGHFGTGQPDFCVLCLCHRHMVIVTVTAIAVVMNSLHEADRHYFEHF